MHMNNLIVDMSLASETTKKSFGAIVEISVVSSTV